MAPSVSSIDGVPHISAEGLATLKRTMRYWVSRGRFYTLLAILTSEIPKDLQVCHICDKAFSNTQPYVTGGPPVDGECANYGETAVIIPCGHVVGHLCADAMLEHPNQDGFLECSICLANFKCPAGTRGPHRGHQATGTDSPTKAIFRAYTSNTEPIQSDASSDSTSVPPRSTAGTQLDVVYLKDITAAERAEIEGIRSQPSRGPSPPIYPPVLESNLPRGPFQQRSPSPSPPRGRTLTKKTSTRMRHLAQQQTQATQTHGASSSGGVPVARHLVQQQNQATGTSGASSSGGVPVARHLVQQQTQATQTYGASGSGGVTKTSTQLRHSAQQQNQATQTYGASGSGGATAARHLVQQQTQTNLTYGASGSGGVTAARHLAPQQTQVTRSFGASGSGGVLSVHNPGQNQPQPPPHQQARFHPQPGHYTQEEVDAALTLLDMAAGTRNGGRR